MEPEIFNAYVKDVMNSKAGREVIWELLSRCEIYSSLPGKFVAGRRDVGLQILSILEDADPRLYPKLLLEMQEND